MLFNTSQVSSLREGVSRLTGGGGGATVKGSRWWLVWHLLCAVCCVTPNRTAAGGHGAVGPGRLSVFAVRVLLWWWCYCCQVFVASEVSTTQPPAGVVTPHHTRTYSTCWSPRKVSVAVWWAADG